MSVINEPSKSFQLDLLSPAAVVLPSGATNSLSILLRGRIQPGQRVQFQENGQVLGEATITTDAYGYYYSYHYIWPSAGPHALTATVLDAQGLALFTTAPFTINVDREINLASLNTSALTDTGAAASVVNGGVTNDASIAISGQVEAGSRVLVSLDLGRQQAANVDGTAWQFTTADMAEGMHRLTVNFYDAAGNRAAPAYFDVTVDRSVSEAKFSSMVGTASGAISVVPSVLQILSGERRKINDSTPAFSGWAEAGSQVEILLQGSKIGDAQLTGGLWQFDVNTPLPDGQYSFSARVTDVLGNVARSNAIKFGVDTTAGSISTAPLTGIFNSPFVDVASLQGKKAVKPPILTGRVSDTDIVKVEIFDGAIKLGDASLKGQDFSFKTSQFGMGLHELRAVATDVAGNQTSEEFGDFSVARFYSKYVDQIQAAPGGEIIALQNEGKHWETYYWSSNGGSGSRPIEVPGWSVLGSGQNDVLVAHDWSWVKHYNGGGGFDTLRVLNGGQSWRGAEGLQQVERIVVDDTSGGAWNILNPVGLSNNEVSVLGISGDCGDSGGTIVFQNASYMQPWGDGFVTEQDLEGNPFFQPYLDADRSEGRETSYHAWIMPSDTVSAVTGTNELILLVNAAIQISLA